MPSLAEWFRTEIEARKQEGSSIPEDVEDSSRLPSLQAQRFKSMYAYGYHYRVKARRKALRKLVTQGLQLFPVAHAGRGGGMNTLLMRTWNTLAKYWRLWSSIMDITARCCWCVTG